MLGEVVVSSVVSGVMAFVDRNVKDKNEAEKIKAVLQLFNKSADLKKEGQQVEKILTEMKGNWLQRSWRPIVMIILTVAAVVLNKPEYFELIWKGVIGYAG